MGGKKYPIHTMLFCSLLLLTLMYTSFMFLIIDLILSIVSYSVSLLKYYISNFMSLNCLVSLDSLKLHQSHSVNYTECLSRHQRYINITVSPPLWLCLCPYVFKNGSFVNTIHTYTHIVSHSMVIQQIIHFTELITLHKIF